MISSTESPYFSPIRTRNQRKRIEIEKSKEVQKSSKEERNYKSGAKSTQSLAEVKIKTGPSNLSDNVVEATDKPKKQIISEESRSNISNKRKHIGIKYENKPIKEMAISSGAKSTQSFAEFNIKPEPEETTSYLAEIATDAIYKHKKQIKTVVSPNVKLESNCSGTSAEPQNESLKKSKWEPKNWKIMLENMREMRKDRSAPVDTMGCHKCSDKNCDEKVCIELNLIILSNLRFNKTKMLADSAFPQLNRIDAVKPN